MTVYWFLCGNEKIPSSRIHGINIHKKLVSMGYNSQIVHKPYRYFEDIYFKEFQINWITRQITDKDIVVIQKLAGARTIQLVTRLKKKGVKIIFVDCDLPLKPEMAFLADVVICPAQQLCQYYTAAGVQAVVHIDDAIEVVLPPQSHQAVRTVVWFGRSGLGKWQGVEWFIQDVLPAIRDQWQLVTISNHPDATYPWEGEASFRRINKYDLAIIPVSSSEQDAVKSSNRCTQSFALGLPVLCHMLPSYSAIIKNYENGLTSNQTSDWIDFFKRLEDDAYLKQVKHKAFEASHAFTLDKIVQDWISTLGLIRNRRSLNISLYAIRFSYVWWLEVRLFLYRLLRSKKS